MTIAMLVQVACIRTETGEEQSFEASSAILTQNALTQNALTQNALTQNALTQNALTQNALTQNALTQNALVTDALTDPSARELFKYITSCALPEGAHIDLEIEGDSYSFDGGVGLAPEWGEEGGSCDAECKSWVSGCVISRLDYLGEPLTISIRGEHEALSSTPEERLEFPEREATYFGNIFTEHLQIYACLSPGETEIPRVCGPSLDGCVIHVVGDCDDVCGKVLPDGSFPDCRDDTKAKHHHHHKNNHKHGQKHVGSVTVFLQ